MATPQDIIGKVLPPTWKVEQSEDNDGNTRYFGVGPSGQRVPLTYDQGESPGDGSYNVRNDSFDGYDLGGMGAYLPQYARLWQSGDPVSQNALDQILKNFDPSLRQFGGAGAPVWTEQTPTTIDELLADPRSPIRMENGQMMFRPEQSTGSWNYNTVDRSPLELLAPIALAGLPILGGALGVGAGAVAPTAGAAEAATGLTGLADFSLAAPGTGLGGVGTAGLGLNTAGLGLTPELIAAGGGASAMGIGGGLGLTATAPTGAALTGATLGAGPATGGTLLDAITKGLTQGVTDGAGSATGAAATGATGAATGAATAATGGSAVSSLLKQLGIDASPEILDLLGKGLATGLGVYGANQQAGAANDLFNQYMQMGAPYRAELANLNANPSSFYGSDMVQGALQQGSDAMSRSLSAKVGNPILNPTALQEMQNYTTRGLLDAYNNRFGQLASAGQLGTGPASQLGLNSINASGEANKTLGTGISTLFGSNPYQDFFNSFNQIKGLLP